VLVRHPTPVSLRAAMRTDQGRVRERNEDSSYVNAAAGVAIVSDGMGGHGHGDVASDIAVDVARTCVEAAARTFARFAAAPSEAARSRVEAALDRAVRHANSAVIERARKDGDKHGMGATLEIVVIAGDEAFIAHVGDSRTYLVRDGVAKLLTEDHTIANVMRRAGSLTEADAAVSPMRSVLSNAIGASAQVAIDLVNVTLRPGDRLLVCSDGLYDYFTLDELAAGASMDPPEHALGHLIDQALAGGGHDNITGVLLIAEDPVLDELFDADADQITSPIALALSGTPAHPLACVTSDVIDSAIEYVIPESSDATTRPC
jgi:serine/threonine protein phosphatase PrpC